ncbi:hypothetical protein KQI69_02925 [Eubacterium sp. MSJ-13]|nr:hypothetical protein [Eubacterium sp. MSJ-13]
MWTKIKNVSLLIIETVVIFRDNISGLFSTQQTVIENACIRILCILFFEPICSLYEIPAGVLRGTGRSLLPAVITIIGTCALRIIWIFTIFRIHLTLEILYIAFPISWVITILLILLSFIAVKPLKK